MKELILFLSLGAGVHDHHTGRPEVNLSPYIGTVELGVEYKDFVLKYTHISGLDVREAGYGYNAITVNYVWKFK